MAGNKVRLTFDVELEVLNPGDSAVLAVKLSSSNFNRRGEKAPMPAAMTSDRVGKRAVSVSSTKTPSSSRSPVTLAMITKAASAADTTRNMPRAATGQWE